MARRKSEKVLLVAVAPDEKGKRHWAECYCRGRLYDRQEHLHVPVWFFDCRLLVYLFLDLLMPLHHLRHGIPFARLLFYSATACDLIQYPLLLVL